MPINTKNHQIVSWRPVLLVDETGENHRHAASHCQTLSHSVVSSEIRTHKVSGDRQWLHCYLEIQLPCDHVHDGSYERIILKYCSVCWFTRHFNLHNNKMVISVKVWNNCLKRNVVTDMAHYINKWPQLILAFCLGVICINGPDNFMTIWLSTLSASNEGYYRNALCALNLISTL